MEGATLSGKLCALKIAQDELQWDKRSDAFDRIAQEEIRAGRAESSGIKNPVDSEKIAADSVSLR